MDERESEKLTRHRTAIDAEARAWVLFQKAHGEELFEAIPRFKVMGMNQAELLRWMFACGFHRGWESMKKQGERT